MPTENGFTKSRSGGLSVQLATTDGRVMGGGLAGLLIAATPVRVIFVVKDNILSDRIFKNLWNRFVKEGYNIISVPNMFSNYSNQK